MSATFNYTGTMGPTIWAGALAETDEEIGGIGYPPFTIKKGVSNVNFTVFRPQFRSEDALSDIIDFSYYLPNEREFYKSKEEYDINWLSLYDFFEIDLKEIDPTNQMHSVKSINFDEAIPNAKEILQDIVASGIKPAQMNIHVYGSKRIEPGISLRLSEDISFEDFKKIYLAINSNGVQIDDIGFDKLSDSKFELGKIGLYNSFAGKNQTFLLTEDSQNLLREASTLEELYAISSFTPTPKSIFINELLNKAEALNVLDTREGAAQALKITEYVLDRDSNNTRAYFEMMSTFFRLYSLDEAVQRASIVIDIALEIEPENPELVAYKGFLLTNQGKPEAGRGYLDRAIATADKPYAEIYRYSAENHILLGDIENAVNNFDELLDLSFNDATNKRHQFYALRDYLAIIQQPPTEKTGPLYEKLISDFPQRGKCLTTNYAAHLLNTGNNTSRAERLKSQSESQNCKGTELIDGMLALIEWSTQDGSRSSLLLNLLNFGEVPTGVVIASNLFTRDEIIPKLISNGIDINTVDSNGLAPLHSVLLSNNSSAVMTLINNGADINQTLEGNITPLMISVYLQNPVILKALLTAGADSDIINNDGKTALNIANELGFTNIINLLQ